MSYNRMYRVIVPVLVLILLVGACSPRDPMPVDPEVDFLIDLPRIHIVYDEQGRLQSIAGLHPDILALAGVAPPALGDLVATMMNANLQHIELLHTSRGLFLFVNGEPLPGIGWDAASLQTTQNLLGVFEPQIPMGSLVIRLLPLIRQIGLGVILIVPPAPGEAEIPVRQAGTRLEHVLAPAEPVELEPGTGARIRLRISYDEQGEPYVAGISASELEQLTGADLQLTRLDAATLGFFQSANIQHIALTHRPGGIWLYLNNRALPHIAWNLETLENATTLLEALYGDPTLSELVRQLLPIVELADVDIVVQFPVPAGATAIPVIPLEER